MLNSVIKKLAVVLVLCGGIACLLYFTDLGALFNGEVKKKVEEFKKETEEKIDAKKEEVKKEVKKVEDKIDSNVDKVEDKIDELKKLKLKDIIK
tara:strand:- start:205 stop:486 length:282 start_codon:yes stop_codon:yes gene_type:complete